MCECVMELPALWAPCSRGRLAAPGSRHCVSWDTRTPAGPLAASSRLLCVLCVPCQLWGVGMGSPLAARGGPSTLPPEATGKEGEVAPPGALAGFLGPISHDAIARVYKLPSFCYQSEQFIN